MSGFHVYIYQSIYPYSLTIYKFPHGFFMLVTIAYTTKVPLTYD
jgi:hypothetical protein